MNSEAGNPDIESLVKDIEQALDAQQHDEAQALCARLLQADPALNQAHMLMARAMMPGNNYTLNMALIHETLQPGSYAEIGVATGTSLAQALPQTSAVGIDPEPRIKREIRARARLYPITSDSFFERYNLLEELGTDRLDLAFIDGLHLFEQALKDFINFERYSHPGTTVLIHDCYPPTELSAERERAMAYWAGDVWKLIPCLARYRPDLQLCVIPCMPSGLGLVTNLDSASTVLSENFDDIVRETLELQYSQLEQNREETLRPILNNWDTIKGLLPTAA